MSNNSVKGYPQVQLEVTRANSRTEEEDRISDRIMDSQNFTAYNDTSAMPSHLYGESGFAAFFATLFVIIFATGILLIQTVVYVFLSTAIPTVIRWLILNQLAACAVFLVAPGLLMSTAAVLLGASRWGTPLPPSPLAFCQFMSWLLSFGATGRCWSLAVFSIFVIVITIRGLKAVKRVHVIASIIAVWILTFLLNVHITIPYPQYGVYGVQYHGAVFCSPSNKGVSEGIRTATLVMWVVLSAGLPTVITITIPIITLCYIRRNTITEGAQYNKRIAKFALFLLTGNIVNIISRALPITLAHTSLLVGGIISTICICVSGLPTLIIILVYFKPVRDKLKWTVTCGCLMEHKGQDRGK